MWIIPGVFDESNVISTAPCGISNNSSIKLLILLIVSDINGVNSPHFNLVNIVSSGASIIVVIGNSNQIVDAFDIKL